MHACMCGMYGMRGMYCTYAYGPMSETSWKFFIPGTPMLWDSGRFRADNVDICCFGLHHGRGRTQC